MATRPAPSPIAAGPGPAPPMSLAAGTRLGRYELLYPIAAGGMAHVWAAEQIGELGFRKLVALKTIRPEYAYDASFRAMFLDEARLASRIRHANVVEVLDLGMHGAVVFQAMTYVEGAPLSGWLAALRGARLPLGVAVRVVVDMLHGLHAAHELRDDDGNLLGLVHRDVSPQNLLVGVDGVAKLADFGIAKAFGRITEETMAGEVKGKIRYMAPELLGGTLPASPQSDIFSAGVVLWETLTSRRLFAISSEEAVSGPHRRESVRDPREVADVPAAIAAITMRALATDPTARFATALEMADALERAARAEGVDATHREVAACLDAHLGEKIARDRERLRAARRGGDVTRVKPVAPPPDVVTVIERKRGRAPEASPPRKTGSYLLACVVLGLVALACVGLVVARQHVEPAETDDSPANVGAPVAPVESAPPPVATPSTPPPAPSGGVIAPTARVVEPPPTAAPASATVVGDPSPADEANEVAPATTPAPASTRAPSSTGAGAGRPPATRAPRPRAPSSPSVPKARPPFENPY